MDLLKKDNDFVLVNGDLSIADDIDEVAGRVHERLQSYAFEFFLNDEGLPYFEEMTGKGVDVNRFESLIISVINRTYGVRKIDSLDLIYDTETRQTNINSRIQTVFDQPIEIKAVLPTFSRTGNNILQDLLHENIRDAIGENLLDLSI